MGRKAGLGDAAIPDPASFICLASFRAEVFLGAGGLRLREIGGPLWFVGPGVRGPRTGGELAAGALPSRGDGQEEITGRRKFAGFMSSAHN